MVASAREKFGSPIIDDRRVERIYFIDGTADHADARLALFSESPSSEIIDGTTYVRDRAVVKPIGPTQWEGRATYRPPNLRNSGQGPTLAQGSPLLSFDTGGESQHITQSLSTVASYGRSGFTVPDFKGAIGVTKSGVQGVDIIVPRYIESETFVFPVSQVTYSYRGMLYSLTGRVNTSSFRGAEAGEALFLGARGTQRNDDEFAITFNFSYSPNRTGIEVGDITGIAKKGWEYLDVGYEETIQNKVVSHLPLYAKVEKVYEDGDFDALGIS